MTDRIRPPLERAWISNHELVHGPPDEQDYQPAQVLSTPRGIAILDKIVRSERDAPSVARTAREPTARHTTTRRVGSPGLCATCWATTAGCARTCCRRSSAHPEAEPSSAAKQRVRPALAERGSGRPGHGVYQSTCGLDSAGAGARPGAGAVAGTVSRGASPRLARPDPTSQGCSGAGR